MQGIGNDIIEIKRIGGAIQRHGQRFLDEIFTPQEQAYCLRHKQAERHFAGRFAAKEAIVKALGTGISSEIGWLDIEITNNALGKPEARLSQRAKNHFGNPRLLISISHCQEYAAAVALHV